MDDPRTHDLDPAKRYRVLGVSRGAEISVEIDDAVEQRGVVLTYPEALIVGADITLEIAQVFQELATHLDQEDGTLPEWERHRSEWRKKGTGRRA